MGVKHARESPHTFECAECHRTAEMLLQTRGSQSMCLDCLGIGHLQFLPAASAPLTRRAVRASQEPVVVMRWNTRWSRYERQGVLAEPAVIEAAARDSLVDADVPGRDEVAAVIREQFPGCPVERAEAIALHTAARLGGRGRQRRFVVKVAPDEVCEAVEASVLHVDTGYDDLLMSGADRDEARAQVADRVAAILSAWRDGVAMLDP
ncbi:DUF2293 domain-containing protein [Mycolicibacterium flavescens]|uniref:DUF2293 domain-containing protein n=1 Tax=Mycolicibacterium flavescens TaxID=1776 RepID=A0A1E3RLW3_MYCFV|nr:DUF2293 domain-containing protein [Mycolicibacterium flavescens]MCV7281729.1 DUF2293 domain-containing protein [Mycolicibacterium flavescens]ODQ90873.1 hypothetical protein BHQ18_09170 [Mycolicibacterium flavescens]